MKKEIDNLLARYFGGTASEQDMQTLEQWISTSTENQAYFDQMTNLYGKLGGSESVQQKPNTESAKKSFLAYVTMQKDSQTSQNVVIKHIPFHKSWMFRAASVVLILMLSVSGWFYFIAEHDVVLATQMTLKQRELPDQTQIKLSKNSKITYSSNFGRKFKKILLEGEASFNVGHKGKGTLQICADEVIIEDIGTVFAVSAYPDSAKISVKVHTGKVHFYTKNDNGLMLAANETGTFNKQTKEFQIIKHKTDTIIDGVKHILFNEMELRDVSEIIQKEYSISIRFSSESIANRKITVNFDGENVDMVLQIIAETLDLNVTKDTNGYLLSNNKKPANE